jgi:hypothetical protein
MLGSVKEFNYAEFIKGLEFFSKDDTWLVCRKCCKGGDGRPECEIRNCCQERELDICFDCGEFPCDKGKENTRMIERANEHKKLGQDEWLRQQVETDVPPGQNKKVFSEQDILLFSMYL